MEETEEHEWQGLTEEDINNQLIALGFDAESLEVASDFKSFKSKNKTLEGEVLEHKENDDGTFDIKVKVKVTRKSIKIETVPTNAFMLSSGADDLDDIELAGDESEKTRGELLAEGFSKELVESIPSNSTGTGSGTRTFNRNFNGEIAESDFNEWASELVTIADLCVKVDFNNDGIAERRRIQKSEDVILFN